MLPFSSYKTFPQYDGSIVFVDGFWIKIIFYTNKLMYKGLKIWKIWRQYFLFEVMFVFGYYNELTFVRSKIICQLFFKYNWFN